MKTDARGQKIRFLKSSFSNKRDRKSNITHLSLKWVPRHFKIKNAIYSSLRDIICVTSCYATRASIIFSLHYEVKGQEAMFVVYTQR